MINQTKTKEDIGMKKKTKVIVIISIILILALIICGFIYKDNIMSTIEKISQNTKQEGEEEVVVKDISYEVYYHIAPVARMLIRIEDTQNRNRKNSVSQ